MTTASILGVLEVQLAGGGQDELPLHQPALRLGRGPANDLILDDPRVSAKHARLTWASDRRQSPSGNWLVEDLGSTNGTILNGQRLPAGQPFPLQPTDLLQVGAFALQIRLPQPGEHLPPYPSGPVHLSANPQPGLAVYVGHPLQGALSGLTKHRLEGDTITLGRNPGNDLVVADPTVSGHHARLERFGSTYRIIDLGSTNGLVLAESRQRVREHVLADGDVLHIGPEVALQYRAFVGFLPGPAARKEQRPETQYLDIRSLPRKSPSGSKAGRRITIGRHHSNVLVFDHPRVSRYQAVIEQFGARFRLRDLGSQNGTFVNGKRVEKEVWIKEGDEIRVASHRLVFQEDGIVHFDEAGNIRLDAIRIEKWYSKTANILKGFSISIYPKEFVALVGASGAGKSTLMNALAGFNPANGAQSRVLVNGQNLYTHMDEYRGEMGYVPQEDIIHRELTVYQALDFAAQLRMPADTSREERNRRIMEVLRELGLERQRDNLMTALSGGQRKRVSMGVELLTKPGLFYLDEATSGLDPGTETEMMELLRGLADGGRTVILVTHATKNVMMCDQVVFLARGGYLAFFGPPNEALDYFEQYRTPEERRYKGRVEFDDIYQLIEARGTPEEWGERYRRSSAYQRFVVQRSREFRDPSRTPVPSRVGGRRPSRKVSALRQLLILSLRNLRIMAQDKLGLALMLAVAPLIGAMDFIWGRNLFDIVDGDAAQVITMFFMMGLIGILTGALSSVREIVKEVDIYRRERTVVLKLWPYILSKVWVGIILAAYQSLIFVAAKRFLVDPQFHGTWGFPAMYVTMFLCTLSGYMLGLLISAASPNQNIALFLVVIVLVPQFLFAGALLPRDLIPGGNAISAVTSTRWAFDALVRISSIGEEVIRDPCWQLLKAERDDLTQADKDRLGCRCMGIELFSSCYFPGIRNPDFYNDKTRAQLTAAEPVKPPTPTPYPTFTPYPTPTPLPTPSSLGGQNDYANRREKQGQDYQKRREDQGEEYRQVTENQFTEYQDQMEQYGEDLRSWESDRERAVRGAEGLIDAIYKQYQPALAGDVQKGWLALGIISAVVLVLTVAFQKRKDVI